jgi:hypothetical protein
MKNHQVNIATNASARQEKQRPELQLVIVRLPENVEKLADPQALEELWSRSCRKQLSWEHVEGAHWHPTDDEQVANLMYILQVESLTDESFESFSRVVLPLFGGLYGFFSRQETPPLDWIKRHFSKHIGVAMYWRPKKSDDEVSSVGNESGRTISQRRAQTMQGAIAEIAVCEGLGISDEERRKLYRMNPTKSSNS